MPTYEYACKACGEHLEVVQSFKDNALTECPACAGPLRKVFGNIGITFKGSGFYKTDSRSDRRANGSSPKPAAGTTSKSAEISAAPKTESSGPSSDSGTKTGPKASPAVAAAS
jgi:putative FmdB family regulatory protein